MQVQSRFSRPGSAKNCREKTQNHFGSETPREVQGAFDIEKKRLFSYSVS
jgi:hypothetical protein